MVTMFTSVLQNFSLIFVLFFCLAVGELEDSALSRNHIICNATSCVLDQVLNNIVNGSRVSLLPGNYKLKRNVSLSHRINISIDGLYETERVRIFCDPGVGFSFLRSEGIYLKNLAFVGCGALQEGTSLWNITFNAAIFVVYCKDIFLHNVDVTESTGIGVSLFDVGSNVHLNHCIFDNNKPRDTRTRQELPLGGGGGVNVEFTYCGAFDGDSCTKEDEIEHQKFIHNSSYQIHNCHFKNNYSPGPPQLKGRGSTDLYVPGNNTHMSFGRGGGLSIYISGNASHNTFVINNCSFVHNYALWGGGYFSELVDNCHHNDFEFSGCDFSRNKAKYAGGGVRFGLIQAFNNVEPHQHVVFKNSGFTNNYAMWGGGTSVFSSIEKRSAFGNATSSVKFLEVKWFKNSAPNGAAIGGATWQIALSGAPVVPIIENCTVEKNMASSELIGKHHKNSSNFSYSVVEGQGAFCTNSMPFILKGRNVFRKNSGTAVLIADTVFSVQGSVLFERNSGHDGGAIALHGQSFINILPDTNVTFSRNFAAKGGAIYVSAPGITNRLTARNCFLSYMIFSRSKQSYESPEKWKVAFNFSYNTASTAGHSIYASTLKYCKWYLDTYGHNSSEMLNWTNFHYENDNSKHGNEIATDPVNILFNEEDWARISPSDVTNPTVNLLDERNQPIQGVVHVVDLKGNHSDTGVDIPSGSYFPVNNKKIYSFKLKGKEKRPFSLHIETVTGQVIKGVIPKVTLQNCRPGFVLYHDRCICVKSPQLPHRKFTRSYGVTRCLGDRQVFVRKGTWGGLVTLPSRKQEFVTVPCPANYCSFKCPYNVTCSPSEYLYDSIRPESQCSGSRTSVLCGRCIEGFSVVLGSDSCFRCGNNFKWLGSLVGFFIGGACVVLLILVLNVDISGGHYNACIYFYQVVSLLLRDGFKIDPVLQVIIGLANARVGFGACMWHGMTDLDKMAFSYVLPTYILIVCLMVVKCARKPRCYFTRRSAIRAFCTLFVVSYTTYTSASLELLHFTSLPKGKVVYMSGDVNYFAGKHLYFGLLAIAVGLFIVLPFPIILLFTPYVARLSRRSVIVAGRLKPFIDVYQGCYLDKYRWFSGIYYVARISLLLVFTFAMESTLRHLLLVILCIALLTLQSNIRPYAKEIEATVDGIHQKRTWLNWLDSLILANLCIIALIGSFLDTGNSGLTEVLDIGYSPIDIVAEILMWIPFAYCLVIFAINLHRMIRRILRRIGERQPLLASESVEQTDGNGFH